MERMNLQTISHGLAQSGAPFEQTVRRSGTISGKRTPFKQISYASHLTFLCVFHERVIFL